MQRRIKHFLSGIAVLLLIVASTNVASAQNASDLKINEILVLNDSNTVDDFGMHTAWIEIFNSAYNTVNIGGCYLTDDLSNPTKYWIPTGDPTTKIPSRCYMVFWADNHPTRGIFHLNFDLDGAKTIALFNADGRTLVDKVDLPLENKPDITYGRPTNDSEQWVYLEKSTPGANNDYTRKKTAGESFVEIDPYGVGMTAIAMFVVFSALAILYVIYKNMGRFFIRKAAGTVKSKEKVETKVVKQVKEEISGEVNAAIAMALYMYQSEMHDHENTVLTIQKVSRNYSPWSSKIYTLRKTPR
ncbi:MAG TPA: phage tail protein [Prolixibacteraceae bacterium]|nr:phage tail protein [Marinilabiliales bacterium]HBL77121.1 phage tail protein [Prolixibacteraceae bacterium]HCU59825.1 phage tail protein [Prolixibacteraceae bacterium]